MYVSKQTIWVHCYFNRLVLGITLLNINIRRKAYLDRCFSNWFFIIVTILKF